MADSNHFDRESLVGGLFIVSALAGTATAFAGDLAVLSLILCGVAIVCFVLSRDKLTTVAATLAFVSIRLVVAALLAKSWRGLLGGLVTTGLALTLLRFAANRKNRTLNEHKRER